ncbi:MAG: MBL fold metallo-hydrolase [Bacteroidetes bacterium HGW-Bacteroidetes-21]|nr:MAG: MBL fold metallo-hydrolase [Bacteroidetes bacterium HGW-Bacteroidetes-21]
MKLISLETGNFKIDAGPMFGVIPKSMWSKHHQADENNMCVLANRCLLVDTGTKRIVIDTGIGNKVTDKLVKHYHLNLNENIVNALKKNGYTPESITDVIFTHLHWDHCGGAVDYASNDHHSFVNVFPNAVFHVSSKQWEWALHPNKRESAAYPPEYILPLKDCKINFVDKPGPLFPEINIFMSDGHTPGQIIPIIDTGKHKIAFTADLVPSAVHVNLLWISAYDVYPLTAIDEKEAFLKEALDNNYVLFFEHDPLQECGTLQEGRKGPEIKETFALSQLLS